MKRKFLKSLNKFKLEDILITIELYFNSQSAFFNFQSVLKIFNFGIILKIDLKINFELEEDNIK